jgi:hypothetical protein
MPGNIEITRRGKLPESTPPHFLPDVATSNTCLPPGTVTPLPAGGRQI